MVCDWAGEWLQGRETGDEARTQAAVDAMAGATARTRLHRARLRLRAVVDAIDGDERPLVGDREDPS